MKYNICPAPILELDMTCMFHEVPLIYLINDTSKKDIVWRSLIALRVRHPKLVNI
jgi:hypothetical protein